MNKRLEMLEKITSSGQGDAFAWYGLAMEYRRLDRPGDALAAFDTLRAEHPDYLAMYLMAGQVLLEQNNPTQAKTWLEQGLELAQRTGDSKATGELQDALGEC
jgi:predicted Zn-dependent protease